MTNSRIPFATIALLCLALICIALYMQHAMGLIPCYLCITQRVFYIAIGAVALLAAIHAPDRLGQRIYAYTTGLLAVGGGFFAGKQLWLQSLPEDRIPACGPPVDYLFEVFNYSEAIAMLLRGDGNCAKVQWTLLNISIPGWSLMAFATILIFSCWLAWKKS